MANLVYRLEEQLRRVEDHSRFVVNAAIDNVPRGQQNEIWWQHIVGLDGDE